MATSLDGGCLADLGLGRRNSSATPTCNQSMLKLAPYSPEATAVFATAITLMILFTIVGNILVIIAVLTSRSLRGPQNLFLVSLAAADILVATLIIPFSLANELMGYWYFRSVWCEIYLALDVLFCTSSIVHLCAISLDRYLSISRAVTYGSQRTPRRIKGAITVVWLISAVISFPPLLPMTKSQGGVDAAGGPQCQLNDEKWYVLYSTIGSFFAPCLIMILVYVRIYQIAKKHTRGPPGEPRKEGAAGSGPPKSPVQSQNGRGQGGPATPQRVHKPRPLNLDVPPSPSPRQAKRSISPHNRLHPLSPSLAPTPTTPGSQPLGPFPLSTPSCSPVHQPDVANRPKESKKMKQAGNNNEDSSSSGSDMDQGIGQGDCGASVSRGFPAGGPHSPASAQRLRDVVATSKGAVLSGQRALQDGTPNSTRRKAMANREKRFTFVLAVVIGVFVVCWFPFFFSYSLQAVCPQVCSLPEPLFKFFFWIGYCNSCLNPVIYTIFNKDFRRAFKKILCKNTKGTFF